MIPLLLYELTYNYHIFLGSENQKKLYAFRFVFANFNFTITAPKPNRKLATYEELKVKY